MKKMTKMEAIGELCTIKKDLLVNIDHRAKRIRDKGNDIEFGVLKYLEEEQEKEKRFVMALDMAGKAMTR